MYCRHCGVEIKHSGAYCVICGKKIGDVQEETQPQEAVAATTSGAANGNVGKAQNSWVKIAVGAIAAILIVAVIIAAAIFAGNSSTAQTGDDAATIVPQASSGHVRVSQIDNSAFPEMTLYALFENESGKPIEQIDAGRLKLIEMDALGKEYEAKVTGVEKVTQNDALNINLVFDQSDSMSSMNKMTNAKRAAKSFVQQVANRGNINTELTSFDDAVYNRQPFTTEGALLNSAIDALRPTTSTALIDALYWAIQRTNMRSGGRVVIAFTDGEENASNYSEQDVIELARMTGIPVYIIGIGSEIEESSLRSLANACNGSYFDASEAGLDSVLQRIYDSIYESQLDLMRIKFTSSYNGDQESYREVSLAYECAGNEGFEPIAVATTFEYIPVDSAPTYQSSVSSVDYVLPESAYRRYSRSELEQLSLWELYLARNEIFARHGRGFKNQDLTDYFASRAWYDLRYTPEEFDALPMQLSDIEQDNANLMLEIEKERDSPYLVTAK